MAICNLFNTLNNPSGNFLMFSQYVEDITHDYVEGNDWKVVPSRFVALDIDYKDIDFSVVAKNEYTLNSAIPKYFQNYFENGCAYGRGLEDFVWTPEHSKNLFWNSLWDGNFLSTYDYNEKKLIKELMYYGNINMHSYNEHKGMGYGEIYCYIPTEANKRYSQVILIQDRNSIVNTNNTLEGYSINNPYSKTYYYNKDYIMSFDDNSISSVYDDNNVVDKYKVNTIVVLYDILKNINGEWETVYDGIPMGLYITGMFDDENNLTNEITKYVSSSIGTGTSYGLRICTRFTASTNNGPILSTTETVSDSSYTNICQLMSMQNENLAKMLEIVNAAHNTTQQYKDLLSIVKNNRTNVPYVRNINGDDYWFINGRFVSKVTDDGGCCQELTDEDIANHLNISNGSNSSYNDDYCDCVEVTDDELIKAFEDLGVVIDPDTPVNPDTPDNPSVDYDVAGPQDVEDWLAVDPPKEDEKDQ